MNCKPGDLAVFVKSFCGNEGCIVTCIRLATVGELRACGFDVRHAPVWQTDRPVKCTDGSFEYLATDSYLRPIRDADGQDETLSWKDVPLPSKEKERA